MSLTLDPLFLSFFAFILSINQQNKQTKKKQVGCSHQRAWEYFIESINRPYSFLVARCEPNTAATNKTDINCDNNVPAYMGFNADKR